MIEMKDNVLVQCPDRRFNLRKVRYCLDCEHYGGMNTPNINGVQIEHATADQYQVICNRPITRKLTVIEED